MIALVWQFDVREDSREAFEQIYGADGEWTALARRSRSYLGSAFLRDQTAPTRYLLTEYWSEMVVYERHVQDFTDEIASLTRRRDEMLTAVQSLGVFTALDVPDRSGPTWSRRSGSP
jgi:quinol monooxygenase YgiN